MSTNDKNNKIPELPLSTISPNPAENSRNLAFEDALALTGHGKLNYLAILSCGCIIKSVLMETMGASYFIEFVRCDLNFTNTQTGVLAGICVVGVVTTQLFWGYLSDRYGRKRIILPTTTVSILASFLAAWSNKFWEIIICRYIVGACISAASGGIFAYLGELQTNEHRPFALACAQIFVSVAFVSLPIYAWIIMSSHWKVSLGIVTLCYWRLFMCVGIVPALTGLIILIFLPESPRYYYSIGKLEAARQVMAKMYAWNHKKKSRDYPVDSIQGPEVISKPLSFIQSMKNLRYFVIPPLLSCVLVTHTCAFFIYFTTSGFYVYLPNIVSSLVQNIKNDSYTMCDTFAERDKRAKVQGCDDVHIQSNTYPVLIAAGIFFGVTFGVIGYLSKTQKNRYIYCISAVVFLLWLLIVPFLKHPIWIMVALIIGMGFGCSMMLLMMLILEFFPTSLRSLALCTTYSFGRTGIAVATNVIEAGVVNNCTLTMFLMPLATFATSFLVLLLPDVKAVRAKMETKGFTY